MSACPHRLSWNPDWRCERRGILGCCVEHWLDKARWEWQGRSWYLTFDLSNINRPYLSIDPDRPPAWVSLSYGNGNSDPVAMVEVRLRVPPHPEPGQP